MEAKNKIYRMSQVIGMIRSDQGIERSISIWVVVKDDELMSITILGGGFVVTKSCVNIVSPFR